MANKENMKPGDWISTEDGYAIIDLVHPHYFAKYDCEIPEGAQLGDYNYSMIQYKVYCHFDGKPKRSHRLKSMNMSYVRPLTEEANAILQRSIEEHPKEYAAFLKYLSIKKETRGCEVTGFAISSDDEDQKITESLESVRKKLPQKFSFDDFQKAVKQEGCPIDTEKVVNPYGGFTEQRHVQMRFFYTLGDMSMKNTLFHDFLYTINDPEAGLDSACEFFFKVLQEERLKKPKSKETKS